MLQPFKGRALDLHVLVPEFTESADKPDPSLVALPVQHPLAEDGQVSHYQLQPSQGSQLFGGSSGSWGRGPKFESNAIGKPSIGKAYLRC